MKYHATKKDVKNGYYRIVGVGYCEAQSLLQFESAESYCAGVYGWSCDNYNIDGVCISTGYNYINNKNTIDNNYEIVIKYEKMAYEIVANNRYDYNGNKIKIRKLLNDMIEELKIKEIE